MSAIAVHFSVARLKTIGFWALKLVLAALFLFTGGAKLAGLPAMVEVFERVGFGQWFRYLTGILEVGGAALLLWIPDDRSRRAVSDDRERRGPSGAASRSA
jgi:DoxX-like family